MSRISNNLGEILIHLEVWPSCSGCQGTKHNKYINTPKILLNAPSPLLSSPLLSSPLLSSPLLSSPRFSTNYAMQTLNRRLISVVYFRVQTSYGASYELHDRIRTLHLAGYISYLKSYMHHMYESGDA
ncbi:hypothetical protein WAI453_002056 [Rhynchosporium graminicola]